MKICEEEIYNSTD